MQSIALVALSIFDILKIFVRPLKSLDFVIARLSFVEIEEMLVVFEVMRIKVLLVVLISFDFTWYNCF